MPSPVLMLRFLALAVLVTAPVVASSQPLASEAPPLAFASLADLEAAPLQLAVVVRQQNDGGSCSSSDSSCDGGDCDGGGTDCGDEAGGAACLALSGCAVLTGAAAYGIYRLVKRRRAPEDTLAMATAHALTSHLATHAQIVAPEDAEVVLTVEEMEVRQGVGLAARDRQFVVTATDRRGRSLALDDSPLPSARLVLSATEVVQPETAQRLASRLAQRR